MNGASQREPLLPKHGGYRRLKSFQVAQLAYDVTLRFCDRYIDQRSRTHDQMVQAARRCRTADEVALWVRDCGVDGRDGRNGQHGQDEQPEPGAPSMESIQSIKSIPSIQSRYPAAAANAALVLIGVAISLLNRQLQALATTFEQEGGFTERLYRTRRQRRSDP